MNRIAPVKEKIELELHPIIIIINTLNLIKINIIIIE